MSILRRSDIDNNDYIRTVDAHSNAQRIETPLTACRQPTNEALDPEALMGIEMTPARELNASRKQDDPYLICFDGVYDIDKYAKYLPKDSCSVQADGEFVVIAQKTGQR